MGILVDHARVVQDEVSLTWQDKRFKVWVMEDFREWLPDLLYGTGERKHHNTHTEAPVTVVNQEDGQNEEDLVGVSDDGPEGVAFQPVNSPTARFTGKDVVLENGINCDINLDVSKIKGNVDGSFQVCRDASILEGCHNKDEMFNIH